MERKERNEQKCNKIVPQTYQGSRISTVFIPLLFPLFLDLRKMITLKILSPRCLTMVRRTSNLMVTRFCSAQKVEAGTPGKKKIYVDSRWYNLFIFIAQYLLVNYPNYRFFVPAKFLMAVMVYGGVYVGYTKYQQRQQREAKCEAVEEKAGFTFKMTKYEVCYANWVYCHNCFLMTSLIRAVCCRKISSSAEKWARSSIWKPGQRTYS